MERVLDLFKITEDHLKLLNRTYIGWDYCEYGAPAIDCKRPYGNSYVAGDIAEILGWDVGDELTDEQETQARNLHNETKTVLQIVMVTQKFEPGLYEKYEKYNQRAWRKYQPN